MVMVGNPFRVALRERIREETERLPRQTKRAQGPLFHAPLESHLRQVKWAD